MAQFLDLTGLGHFKDKNDALYAKQDGSYEGMTVGNAEQLVSTVGVEDNAPYTFRTTGGSADVGDRMNLKAVVGGTVAWNQLINKASLNGGTNNDITVTADTSTGEISVSGTASADAAVQIYPSMSWIADHVYYMPQPSGASASTYFIRSGSEIFWSYGVIKKYNATQSGNLRMLVKNGKATGFSFKPQLFDLTAMFGSTIADYVYTLESGTAGAGVAWLKKYGYFTKPYYPYKAAALESVKTSAHKTIGFNQLKTFLGYSTASSVIFNIDNAVRVIKGYSYEFNHGAVSNATTWRHAVVCYDLNGAKMSDSGLITVGSDGMGYNASGKYYVNSSNGSRTSDKFVSNFDGYIIPFITVGDASASTIVENVCVHLAWDGERDGEYEPYEAHTYALDDVELRGIPKLDASNNLYYDGDTYEADGTVTRKYGIVDLGTLDWQKTSGKNNLFNTRLSLSTAAYGGSNNAVCKAVCAKYVAASSTSTYANETDKTVSFTSTGYCYIEDSAYTDAATFKTAMSGVYLVYELATQTTESADAYTELQICNDFGTEEFVDAATRDFEMPCGSNAVYQPNLRAKLEMAPNSPSNGNGDYIVRQTDGVNEYVLFSEVKELPDLPTTDGTYTLKCTVADGTATLSWVSE